MLSMRIDSLVAAIVSQELQGKGRKKEALHFHFDIGLSHHTDQGRIIQRRGLHLLYQLNPHSSYISVFSAVTRNPFTKIEDIKEWKHETTHDSCWRDIPVFSDIYFDMAEKLNATLKDEGLKEVAPKDMTEHNGIPTFGNMYEWVGIEITKDPTDQYNYKKIVKVLL